MDCRDDADASRGTRIEKSLIATIDRSPYYSILEKLASLRPGSLTLAD
jgi:hypothetical protein